MLARRTKIAAFVVASLFIMQVTAGADEPAMRRAGEEQQGTQEMHPAMLVGGAQGFCHRSTRVRAAM